MHSEFRTGCPGRCIEGDRMMKSGKSETGGGKLCLAIMAMAFILLSSCVILAEDSSICEVSADSVVDFGKVYVKVDGVKQSYNDQEDFETIDNAVEFVNKMEGTVADGKVVIECESGKPIKCTGVHIFVKRSVTILGNNAYAVHFDGKTVSQKEGLNLAVDGGAEGEEANKKNNLLQDTVLRIDSFHNIGIWGTRYTSYEFTLVMENCSTVYNNEVKSYDNGMLVLIGGTTGVNNITLRSCTFGSNSYYDCVDVESNGKFIIDSCRFEEIQRPINLTAKASTPNVDIQITNSTFVDCGTGDTDKNGAAPIKVNNAGSQTGSMALYVEGCTFSYSEGKASNNGDILIGDGRAGKTTNPFPLTVKNTNANIEWQDAGCWGETKETETAGGIGTHLTVKELKSSYILLTVGKPAQFYDVSVASGTGGSVQGATLIVSQGISVSSSDNVLTVGTQTFTATASEGYVFSNWAGVSGSTIGSSGTIKAEFSPIEYTVKIAVQGEGSVDEEELEIPYGTAVSVKSNVLTMGDREVVATASDG